MDYARLHSSTGVQPTAFPHQLVEFVRPHVNLLDHPPMPLDFAHSGSQLGVGLKEPAQHLIEPLADLPLHSESTPYRLLGMRERVLEVDERVLNEWTYTIRLHYSQLYEKAYEQNTTAPHLKLRAAILVTGEHLG